jgi:uncharacterized membrane protein
VTRIRWTTADVGRVQLLVVAVWITIVVIGNVIDALCAVGVLPKGAPFASGNLALIGTVLAKLAIVRASPLAFAIAIFLEALSAFWLWAAVRRRDHRSEDLAFAILLALFGGFVAVDELAGLYELESVHRSLVTFVAVLYLVVRLTRTAAPSVNVER